MGLGKQNTNEKKINTYEKGKAIFHAVNTIGNKHLIQQINLFQRGLQNVQLAGDSNYWIKEIEQFKSGVNMSGNKINKVLKDAILEYCDLLLEYYGD